MDKETNDMLADECLQWFCEHIVKHPQAKNMKEVIK